MYIMPLSTYMKLTDERLVEIDIRLSLASHSYIYPLGIAKDILVDVASYVYPMDFAFLDVKEDEKRPFILGTPFMITAKAMIKFDKGTITLRSRKSFYADSSTDIANKIACRKFLIKNEEEFFIVPGDGVGDNNLTAAASPSRKAHLLEDKQIPSLGVFNEVFLALGWNLKEIHVTWDHLENKRTRLRLYTKNHKELCRNDMGQGLAHRLVIVVVSCDLRGDSWGCVPQSLFWREDLDRDGERKFDYLNFALVLSKAYREGVGLVKLREIRVDSIKQ
ncbi:reverse transcriptase domain-containing protein [Tanacetum coccineum]